MTTLSILILSAFIGIIVGTSITLIATVVLSGRVSQEEERERETYRRLHRAPMPNDAPPDSRQATGRRYE